MQIYYNNKIDATTIVTESSSVSGSPATDVQRPHLVRRWKTTGITDESLSFFMGVGTPYTPAIAILAGHNLTASAVVKIQGHTANTWGAPDVDITMDRVGDVYTATVGFSSKLYWRFHIADGTNPDGFISVGRMWLGGILAINGPSSSSSEEHGDTSTISQSRTGQVFGDVGYRYRRYDLFIPYWTSAMKANIETMLDFVVGGVQMFVAIDESNLPSLPMLYCTLEPGMRYNNLKSLTKWSGNLKLREAF